MKTLSKSILAAIAATGLLAGCASYDYGYAYSPPYAYGYDYGPYYYDYGYGPYYYGPSYYVGPSVGLGFTYRDRDYAHGYRYDRNRRGHATNYAHNYQRHGTTRPTVTHPQRNVAPAGSRSRPAAPPPVVAHGGYAPNTVGPHNSQQ